MPARLTDDDRAALLAAIEAEEATARTLLVDLARDHDEIVEAQGWSPNDDEHDPEGSTVAVAREQLAALLAQARADLDALAAARRALADGTAGTCTRCGGPIGLPRLLALPTTSTCVACAALPAR